MDCVMATFKLFGTQLPESQQNLHFLTALLLCTMVHELTNDRFFCNNWLRVGKPSAYGV